MALSFPSNPTVGQTYNSGSSATYQWNGQYWSVSNPLAANFPVQTSSYAPPSIRKNIVSMSRQGYGFIMFLTDENRLYMAKQGDGGTGYAAVGTLNPSGSDAETIKGLADAYEIVLPGETGSIVSCSLQGMCAYVLIDNGNLWGWGNNGSGQLGIGNSSAVYMPRIINTQVSHFYEYISNGVTYDNYFALIKKVDGYVYGAGYNATYQFYTASTSNQTSWVQITPIGQNPMGVFPWGSVNGGTIAQKADGTVIVIGRNVYNELGVSNGGTQVSTYTTASGWLHSTSSLTMSLVQAFSQYDDGSRTNAGNVHALMTSGSITKLMACGRNDWGNLGNGNTTNQSTPVPVALPASLINGTDPIKKFIRKGGPVGAGFVLSTTGKVYAWGYNYFGQVGDATTTNQNTPILVVPTGALDMMCEDPNTYTYPYYTTSPIVRLSDGTYHRTGYSYYGATGNGIRDVNNITATMTSTGSMMRLPAGTVLKYATDVMSRNQTIYTVAVTTDNRVYSWGFNNYFGISWGTEEGITYPIPVEVTPDLFYNY